MIRSIIRLVITISLAYCVTIESNARQVKTEKPVIHIALISDAEIYTRQSYVFEIFLKGFLESVTTAGYSPNKNLFFESFMMSDHESGSHERIASHIKAGNFDLILCLGNRYADYLIRKGIPSRKILVFDDVIHSNQISNKDQRTRVISSIQLTRKFEILQKLFPGIEEVICVFKSSIVNSNLIYEELNTKKGLLRIKDVKAVAVDTLESTSKFLDSIKQKRTILYLTDDNFSEYQSANLFFKALARGIPVVSHNGSEQNGSILSINADARKIGIEVGELAVETFLGINSHSRKLIFPQTEHITFFCQNIAQFIENPIYQLPNLNSGPQDNRWNTDSQIENFTWLSRTAVGLFGKNLTAKGRFFSYENDNWNISACNIPLREIINEVNTAIRLAGHIGVVILKGDPEIRITLYAVHKSLKEILDKIMISAGGICNQTNQDDFKCFVPETSKTDNEQIINWAYRPHGMENSVLMQSVAKIDSNVSIEKFDESNIIIFTGTLKSLVKIRDYLLTIDIVPPEVLIELLVIEFIHGNQFSWGIDISSGQKNHISKAHVSPGTLNPISLTYNVLDSLKLNFNANVRALSMNNEARIITNPHVATKNGEVATISSKEQRYITLESYDYESNRTSHMLQQLDAGIELRITPWILADNNIKLHLNGDLSVFGMPSSEANAEHLVNATKIESSITVKDGATLIIGGLIKSESSKAKHKIPILGSIPLIGIPFTRIDNIKNMIETVIYVTPHIYPIDNHDSVSSWTELEHIINEIKNDINKSFRVLDRIK